MNAHLKFALLTVSIPPEMSTSGIDNGSVNQTASGMVVRLLGAILLDLKSFMIIHLISESDHPLLRTGLKVERSTCLYG
ncbi:MAG: hypothetical protein LGB01_06520 [Sulfurovum sp.]|nr:hypothetical protein [Sulfurovum sp.]